MLPCKDTSAALQVAFVLRVTAVEPLPPNVRLPELVMLPRDAAVAESANEDRAALPPIAPAIETVPASTFKG
jgi:hypothetical protein